MELDPTHLLGCHTATLFYMETYDDVAVVRCYRGLLSGAANVENTVVIYFSLFECAGNVLMLRGESVVCAVCIHHGHYSFFVRYNCLFFLTLGASVHRQSQHAAQRAQGV